ncbi:MAG: hypothetical protein KF688_06425 [Pirellulales bacterium]|nr:hypothetical protein [Pirellulales bacterium]
MTHDEPSRSPGRLALSLLGLAGMIACLVGAGGAWFGKAQLQRAVDGMGARVDESLGRVEGRVERIRKLADEAKLDLQDLEQRLADWSRREAGDRVAERLDLAERSARLADGARQQQSLLAGCRDALLLVHQSLELGARFGLAVDADVVDELLDRLAKLDERLEDAVASATSLGARFGDEGPDVLDEDRLRQAGTIAAKLLATSGAVDEGLAAFSERLDRCREAVAGLSGQVNRRLTAAAVAATLLLAWMAAGQFSLWRRA